MYNNWAIWDRYDGIFIGMDNNQLDTVVKGRNMSTDLHCRPNQISLTKWPIDFRAGNI